MFCLLLIRVIIVVKMIKLLNGLWQVTRTLQYES